MVRDNLIRTAVQSQKQNEAAETQSQSEASDEPAVPEPAQSQGRAKAQSPVTTERNLDFLLWSDEAEFWGQPETAASLPSHLRPFRSKEEYKLVKRTYQQLLHSGFYWGPMTMERAHEILAQVPLGTFLLRDSGQPDIFFTLSYQSDDGPTSVRVQLNNLHFSLYGSQKTFESLFALLTYYTSSSCKLTVPYRQERPEFLKQMCRRALIQTYGAENISNLPGLSNQVKPYVLAYPHCI